MHWTKCFRSLYQDKVAVIIDCFELFTEKPSGALNQVQTYSNYNHHQTVKSDLLVFHHREQSVSFQMDGVARRQTCGK